MQNGPVKRIELRTEEGNQLMQPLKNKAPVLLVGSPIFSHREKFDRLFAFFTKGVGRPIDKS